MKYILSFALSLTALFSCAQGTKIDLSEFGLNFTIPDGWNYTFQEDILVMGHHTIPGLMLAFENTTLSAEALKQTAVEGIHEPTVDLNPSGAFEIVKQNQVQGFYTGTFEGTAVKSFAVGKINGKGKGVTVLILTEQSSFSDTHVREAKKLIDSVNFFQEKDTPQTAEWKNALKGKQLKYLSSSSSTDYNGGYSGSSSRTNIWFYTDNTFEYYSSSLSSFDTGGSGFGYASGQDSNQGQYRIYSIGNLTYLELHFNDDRFLEYTLERNAEDQTLLNGTRYFLVGLDE